ncbi:hypothetical protein JNB62_10875 [Microbacterium jejuense]|uniref:Lipoprotein n=1 Tax=Microbacterium jejuense TaxID=1263637 RepID=A0ABS7HMJ4_9MICO|nr:hypothetical protein [Microbacterium jejuense]MBW9094187.1 hypothetical protein [Microbacterium jejuense]
MTGCAAAAPEGNALYQDGEQRFTARFDAMHSVLMAVEDGEWDVTMGGYGAGAGPCPGKNGSGDGYVLSEYRRSLPLDGRDPQQVSDDAVAAFKALGLEPETTVFGADDRAQWNVIAEGDPVGRAVVSVEVDQQKILVSADAACTPGDWTALDAMVFDDPDGTAEDLWRRTPATEGPDSVPMFYFPADGPLFWNEDGTPVEPQPVITDPPRRSS